ncbi:hypothetical protein AB205_0022990 [Aquarana catesbeiana]|uniref:Uncharacterized protein n=1 Tax=Aquarana catesbeiana TaxID=8400 RepID=A0A2G9QH41_AQUCT|nr:hypothetical protein AB205_0022990 [Aquarana catesbeiana]
MYPETQNPRDRWVEKGSDDVRLMRPASPELDSQDLVPVLSFPEKCRFPDFFFFFFSPLLPPLEVCGRHWVILSPSRPFYGSPAREEETRGGAQVAMNVAANRNGAPCLLAATYIATRASPLGSSPQYPRAGLLNCLRYFLPPNFHITKNELSTMSAEDLIAFPLVSEKYLLKHKTPLVKFYSDYKCVKYLYSSK